MPGVTFDRPFLHRCEKSRPSFENLLNLEELLVCPIEPNIIDNTIKYILPNLPKLKILHLLSRVGDDLKKKQCMVLEQFLAEQNRKLFFRVPGSVFSKLMVSVICNVCNNCN